MSIALVHHFQIEAGSGENLSPGVDHAFLAVDDRMVEGEAVQVECLVVMPPGVIAGNTAG